MNFHNNLLLTFSIIDISFILDVFEYKSIKHVTLFHCTHLQNLITVSKIFNRHSIQLTAVQINNDTTFKINKSYTKIGVVIQASCENWDSLLTPELLSFQDHDSFVIVAEDLTKTTEIVSKYPFEASSDLTIAIKVNNTFDLFEVYNTGSRFGGTFNVIHVGYWNSHLVLKKVDRRNLQGIDIEAAIVQVRDNKLVGETIEQYVERAQVKVDTVNRMKYFTLLKYLRDMYNITYNLQRVSSWGYPGNASFDGMVGALSHGTAEIGGSPIFFRSDRALYIQYIAEIWHSRHSFLFRHPKHPGGFYTIYTRPLATIVWYCGMALVVLSGILLWLTLWAMQTDTNDSSASLALLTIWGAFCQQGSLFEHQATSVKLVLFIMFACAVTTYQYYNATIVSSLLQEPPKNIRTMKDLVSSDLKVGVDDVIYVKDYFKRTTDPTSQELYKKKLFNGTRNIYSSEKGIALVKAGGFAFHIDTTIAFSIIKDTFNEREVCELSSVQMWPVMKMGIALRIRSPYKEFVTYGVRRIYESGIPVRVKSIFDTAMPDCVHTPDSSIFRVNIREFSMPLIALACGMAIAIVIFICELLLANTVRHKAIVRKFIIFRNWY